MERITEKEFVVPVNSWLPSHEIEPGAMDQIENTASHPEAVLHVAVMPDCHQGFGVTTGTAFATEGSIVPNAVRGHRVPGPRGQHPGLPDRRHGRGLLTGIVG